MYNFIYRYWISGNSDLCIFKPAKIAVYTIYLIVVLTHKERKYCHKRVTWRCMWVKLTTRYFSRDYAISIVEHIFNVTNLEPQHLGPLTHTLLNCPFHWHADRLRVVWGPCRNQLPFWPVSFQERVPSGRIFSWELSVNYMWLSWLGPGISPPPSALAGIALWFSWFSLCFT